MVRITRMTKKRLGELLKDEGLLTDAQIQEALSEQRKSGELLGEVLVRLGYVTEEDIAQTIVAQFGLPYIEVKQYFTSDEVLRLFSAEAMRKYQFFPLDKIGNVVTVAVGGLLNFDMLAELEAKTGCKIQVYVSTWSSVREAIEKRFGAGAPAPAEEVPAAAGKASPEEAGVGEAAVAASEEDLGLSELGNLLLGDEGSDEKG